MTGCNEQTITQAVLASITGIGRPMLKEDERYAQPSGQTRR